MAGRTRTIVALPLLVLAGCKTYPIEHSAIGDAMQRYYEATARYAETPPPEQFIHVAHKAGFPAEYPDNLNGAQPTPAHPARSSSSRATSATRTASRCGAIARATR